MTTTSWLVPMRHSAPADLELWLEEQAARGRVLTEFDSLAPLRLTFEESEPATIRYALEYRGRPAPMDYFRSREDLGWQFAGRLGDLHLWSREYRGERPDGLIGGDDLSLRTDRLGVGLAVFGVIALVVALVLGFVATTTAALTVGVVGGVAVVSAAGLAVSRLTARTRNRSILEASQLEHC